MASPAPPAAAPAPAADEALSLLLQELEQQHACVARASCILGCLQDRLFETGDGAGGGSLAAAVDACLAKFQQQLVAPAAAKLGRCKTAQDKVLAVAKFLQKKLAKAPAHKQPLHTQFLPSALRGSGKRQLDCLGIATAVLGMCHAIAAADPGTHSSLAAAMMVVSDDHCWLGLPSSASSPAAAGSEAAEQLLHVEVTDPRLLDAGAMGCWLYAGGHGRACSSRQVLLMLVAGLMPEELKDEAAAGRMRAVQQHLLQQLADRHPGALPYSTFFRWGLLVEELELERLAAAAEAGSMADLQQLALQGPGQLASQLQYARSASAAAAGDAGCWLWHPSSCATFGWLNRMQAALCGDSDDLLLLTTHSSAAGSEHDDQGQEERCSAAAWLQVAVFLLQQALAPAALGSCTAVLLRYRGCAGKPDKAADSQLLEAVSDIWANLADACQAVACLQQLQGQRQQQQQQQQQEEGQPLALPPASDAGEPPGHRVPAAAAATRHNPHLAAAVAHACGPGGTHGAISDSSLLLPLVLFMDAVCAYFGDDSADQPPGISAHFVAAAGCFSGDARRAAVAEATAAQLLQSARLQALADGGTAAALAWAEMRPDLQQLVRMPGSRRKRKR